jgi:hypothetical protein
MSRLIQFFHPGSEPELTSTEKQELFRKWNMSKKHTRCFLTTPGACVSSPDSTAPEKAQLVFWGEWEGPATVRPISANPLPGFPENLFIPHSERFLVPKEGQGACHNTDPFVFGPEFLYGWCKQETKLGKTLRKLERGDVILFGSKLGKKFVLDTVFVVASFIEYKDPTDLASYQKDMQRINFPLEFVEASIRPIAVNSAPDEKVYRLYRGATFSNPVNGMFSYAPALPSTLAPLGFARPSLLNPPLNFISDSKQTQGIKITDEDNEYEIYENDAVRNSVPDSWRQVTSGVLSQGLRLGVHFQLPSALLYFPKT